ncbi:hypothetical protein DMH18_30940 [Streptomyces sp. WAC 06783]|uniref:aminotransferase class I/II-fold pyridoxal phosphate-dependent enzyme n=1 Tax=Streptomyces sp. WAC 06783 TaxID=2203211 RepID=UPI000F73785B|nr:aminotransferase class I/II-fold pyridoxal phosphate-dependent enzyme [Streptomyces sp. WAC 06783]RSO05679.1 hypothetical protein DMH18_30940 [Streptomyces sp. WAC 06783]
MPGLDKLGRLVSSGTKLIAVNNPDNPAGALIDEARIASITDLYERGISTGSMSKPYSLAGLRLGWIVGPARLLAEVATHGTTTPSASAASTTSRPASPWRTRTRASRAHRITRTNLAVLDEWVTGRDDITYVKPASGTTALLRYSAPVGSHESSPRLLGEIGVMFTPGAAFGIEHTVRIGFADDTATLRAGLALVGQFFDRLAQD